MKKIGIGFATGRKGFQQVLKTYVYSWNEDGLVNNSLYSLNVFVAYDLSYNKTKVTDYTNVNPELLDQIDSIEFVDNNFIDEEIEYLIKENVLTLKEAQRIFGKGYAAKRNAILYRAIKEQVDFLIFLDDDEYPMAVTNTKRSAIWGGQHVLSTHLDYIREADITHGHHCGYISPIPYVQFDENLTEEVFRKFIEAISNDIINWDNIMHVMSNGGVTYADTNILTARTAMEVEEVKNTKFISGANLCVNLTDPSRVFPFYNPPDARGEDTFLSTCLTDRKVVSVPCYTFHDGFSTYKRLLEGVLPTQLKFSRADNKKTVERFYRACLGWVRYKPLLLYITEPDAYEEKIADMQVKLDEVLPIVAKYFHYPEFLTIAAELQSYHKNRSKHYKNFQETKMVWAKIMDHFAKINNQTEGGELDES